MSKLKFVYGTHELEFSVGSSYPYGVKEEGVQAVDRTAVGLLEVESFGIDIPTRRLDFVLLPKADYMGLVDWLKNIVNWSAKEFYFVDEYGAVAKVVFSGNSIDFQESQLDRFNGSITLEVVR